VELRDIEIFLTLAEELHFGRTAERLRLTTARVSQSIKKQERIIGAPLFDRTTRAVQLTPLGKLLRDDLLPAHLQIQQAVDRAIAEARGIIGTLRVGYTTPWCADLALQSAKVFMNVHPGCTVQIQEIQFNDPFGPLRRGELDIHLTELPVQLPGITEGPILLREPRALMVPADHPLARRDSVSLEELADVPLIRPDGDFPQSLLDLHVPVRSPMGRPIPNGPSYTFWPEIPALVAAGLGASIVAACAARYHDRPGIAFVPFRDGPTLDYGVLCPASGHTPPVVAFIDLLTSLADTTTGDE
jgi:DNA-binding transcriptional LysR family regulator